MNEKTIYALGFFDGVHLGHQALLRCCADLAGQLGVQAGVITFASHPDGLVHGEMPALLNTNADRARLLRRCGVRHIWELPFDERMMKTHWSEFLTGMLALGAAGFVCGEDFRFGAGGLGTAKKLEAFCRSRGLPCAIVPEQTVDGIRVSSTHIRSLIRQGDMEAAGKFLGHPHILSGVVTHGRQLGRTIGVPTANILLPQGIAVPELGVYACRCAVDGRAYTAVTNIGSRPTVDGHQTRAESWILDFEGDLYGREITLEFHKFLRPERKFDTLEALKTQIRRDADIAREAAEKQDKKV